MSKPAVIDASSDAAWRAVLLRTAVGEIEAIIRMLDDQADDGAIDPDLWRGTVLRLNDLTSVAEAVLFDDKCSAPGKMADMVYGPGRWTLAGQGAGHV